MNPRAWCDHWKGPCELACQGLCVFSEAAIATAGEAIPVIPQARNMDGTAFDARTVDLFDTTLAREQRMPPGTQLLIAGLCGLIVGLIGGFFWPPEWWPA